MTGERVEQFRDTWKYRVVEATRGNQTALGCIIIAILGKQPANPPRLGTKGATIRKDGFVYCTHQLKTGEIVPNGAVCSVRDLIDNLRGLADHLKLSDAERLELMSETRKWIVRDERATSDGSGVLQ